MDFSKWDAGISDFTLRIKLLQTSPLLAAALSCIRFLRMHRFHSRSSYSSSLTHSLLLSLFLSLFLYHSSTLLFPFWGVSAILFLISVPVCACVCVCVCVCVYIMCVCVYVYIMCVCVEGVYVMCVSFSTACPSAISLRLSVFTSLCLIRHRTQPLRTAGLNSCANLPFSLSLSLSLSRSLYLSIFLSLCVCVCLNQHNALCISLVTHYLVSLH